MLKCWNVEPEIRPRFEFCLKVLKSYMAMPLDYVNISHDCKFKIQNLFFFSFHY